MHNYRKKAKIDMNFTISQSKCSIGLVRERMKFQWINRREGTYRIFNVTECI